MKRFNNYVQYSKYKILYEIVKSELNGNLLSDLLNIPKRIVPGPKAETRCCIYKERAIANEQIKQVFYEFNNNIINTVELACDECPVNRFSVTEACRGCLAHHCVDNCPVNAIEIINKKAHINQDKCIECGKCHKLCQFEAISDVKRPCRTSCKVNAINVEGLTKKVIIDRDKCINCGSCVSKCPFGAIVDKSYILDIVRLIENSEKNTKYKVYCIIAPAIAAQFPENTIEQVINAIKSLGFYNVIEAAIGADMVAEYETTQLIEELRHKSFITSSCCPAFVSLIETKYSEFKDNISPAVSPMIATARLIRKTDSNCKIVFIGPCVAKKHEAHRPEFKGDIDYVMGFEELLAYLDASEIDVSKCSNTPLENASKFGRLFARSGGLTESIKHVIDSNNLNIELKPVICNGLTDCEKALKLAKIGKLNGNFIEGMICDGGCVNGPSALNKKPTNIACINSYAEESSEKTIKDSLRIFNINEIKLKI